MSEGKLSLKKLKEEIDSLREEMSASKSADPEFSVPDIFSQVVEIESKTEELEAKIEDLKEALIKTANGTAQLFGDFKKMYFEHLLTPDAHNSAVVWKKRNDLEKKRKEAAGESDK
jgi:predicted RND superfamily exporter protein